MARFVERNNAPGASNLYYKRTNYGGYNPCILGNSNGRKYTGCVLPNCVGYAWGRWCECQGYHSCNLSTGNAKTWYGHTSDGYRRSSSTPKLGSVICWTGKYGHVAVVERIYSSTDVLWSESNWSGTSSNGRYWRLRRGNPRTLYSSSGLTFQGYIYTVKDWDGNPEPEPPDPPHPPPDPPPDPPDPPGPDPDPTDPDNPDMTESGWIIEAWDLLRMKKKRRGGKILI